MVSAISKDEIRGAIEDKLSSYFCVTGENATTDQVFQSSAMVLREIMSRFRTAEPEKSPAKRSIICRWSSCSAGAL